MKKFLLFRNRKSAHRNPRLGRGGMFLKFVRWIHWDLNPQALVGTGFWNRRNSQLSEIRKYTVNRSSFVHKDAREQFEMRIHKRLIDILRPNPKVIDALTNLTLPAGVEIEIKM